MISCDDARKYFTYLKTGKKYFNHAAISPLSSLTRERIENYLNIRCDTDIEPYFKTLSEAEGAKNKLASLLNVSSNQLAWSPNVSESINILAQGLKWNSGDEIILNNIEFPSNVYPFLNLKEKGVKVLFAQSEEGRVGLQQIEKLVTSKTKLISISLVQFLTGYRVDLDILGNFCKQKDIIFCVDGIQGTGTIQIDIQKSNIDFFTGGSHKWLMGLQGLGYFYLSDILKSKINQKHVGWTSVKNPWNLLDYKMNLVESGDSFQTGTLPRLAIIALNASLDLFMQIGLDTIENRIINNSLFLHKLLLDSEFDPVLKNISSKDIAGIISFNHRDAEIIVKKLEENNTICSVREGIVRISPHFYNTKDELEQLVDEIKNIVNSI